MKKRLFALILAGLMTLSIVGCGKSSSSDSETGGSEKSANVENTETKELKLGHPLGPAQASIFIFKNGRMPFMKLQMANTRYLFIQVPNLVKRGSLLNLFQMAYTM